MGRFGIFGVALVAVVAGWVCAGCSSPPAALPQDSGTGPRFVLELTPGAQYRTTTRWFLFEIPVYPQVAAWVESPDGSYLGTLFVTAKTGRNAWVSAPDNSRPEALPVWSHMVLNVPDGVSAATSSGATLAGSDLAAGLGAGTYVIKLEVNRSYDFNSRYTPEVSGVCGQPSLIYEAPLVIGAGPVRGEFQVVGTGAVDGADGQIRKDLEGIDTALDLFSGLEVWYRQ